MFRLWHGGQDRPAGARIRRAVERNPIPSRGKDLTTTDGLLVGIGSITFKQVIMFGVAGTLIWLAIAKDYEPSLLLPIGFGAILANIPFSAAVEPGGFLDVLHQAGIANELFPVLIFIAIGAMSDFAPLLRNPYLFLFGGAAQFGVFFTVVVAALFGFTLKEAAAIGIIGAADGPTSIFVANRFAPHLLAPITVAAFSYISLVPIIQPAIIRRLTSRKERQIRMVLSHEGVSRTTLILFPIMVTAIAGLIAPISVPLIGSLMFGNLLRESGVVHRLSEIAQNELASLVTLLLGITIGSTMRAETFLTPSTLLVLGMGLVAFAADTAGGVLFAKFLNLFLKPENRINPMLGASGISAFPMSARVVARMALKDNPQNYLLMHAVGANVSGQIASVVAGGLILALVGQSLIG